MSRDRESGGERGRERGGEGGRGGGTHRDSGTEEGREREQTSVHTFHPLSASVSEDQQSAGGRSSTTFGTLGNDSDTPLNTPL